MPMAEPMFARMMNSMRCRRGGTFTGTQRLKLAQRYAPNCWTSYAKLTQGTGVRCASRAPASHHRHLALRYCQLSIAIPASPLSGPSDYERFRIRAGLPPLLTCTHGGRAPPGGERRPEISADLIRARLNPRCETIPVDSPAVQRYRPFFAPPFPRSHRLTN